MKLRQRLARWLGYGEIEWGHSIVEDLPIRIVSSGFTSEMPPGFVSITRYPGGVNVLPGELGTDGHYRVLLSPPSIVDQRKGDWQ